MALHENDRATVDSGGHATALADPGSDRLAFAEDDPWMSCPKLPWEPPGGSFRESAWHDDDSQLLVTRAETGKPIGAVALTNVAAVSTALEALARAFTSTTWPLWQRREAIAATADLLAARTSTAASLICAESSKTIREAEREVARAVETLRVTARSTHVLRGGTIDFADSPRGADRTGWYEREPVGVVAAITSYNDPLNLAVHKVAPALLAGNCVALKPAEFTPFSCLFLADLLLSSGVRPDRLAVLPGTGATTGEALVSDPRVDLVSFTGGVATGNRIARTAGARRLHMELGGNGPVIVCADADIELAVPRIVDGAFGFAGQNCISVQRVLVHSRLVDDLLTRLAASADTLRLGARWKPDTDMGCLIDERAARRVQNLVDHARREGAQVVAGGRRRGAWVEPTVLTAVPTEDPIWRDEVFGPVVSVAEVTDDDSAVALANNTAYGLQAGVFTATVDRALRIARGLRVGGVMVNDSCDFRLDSMPFGGFRGSSLGREGVDYALHAMSEPKIISFLSRT